MQVRLGLRCWLDDETETEVPAELFELMDGIARGGNLRVAASGARLSYRHAWGIVKQWERRIGTPLVSLERGRGARITPAGETLRGAWHRAQAKAQPALAESARHLARVFAEMRTDDRVIHPVIAASHGYGMAQFVAQLRLGGTAPEVHYVGSVEALKRYAAGTADIAGFHLPIGRHGGTLWMRYKPYLDARRDVLLLVETRELGFMTRPGTAKVDVRAIAERRLRFQNRQQGAGSRLIFDLQMEEAGVAAPEIRGYHDEEYTHVAVAAVVAGGGADVAFGARAAAAQFKLDFWPEITEKYLMVIARDRLRNGPLRDAAEVLASRAFRRAVQAVPGSDARGSGRRFLIGRIPALFDATRR
ncbi:MAG: substrate-binding domain-containing protein [Gammaproteobacteria bacterium]